jgi:hypothetical protein
MSTYDGYPRRKLAPSTFNALIAPNVSVGSEATYPETFKVDGGVTAVPILGGGTNEAPTTILANGATVTDDQVKSIGLDGSAFAKLRGSVRSDKAITLVVFQNPYRYNGTLHWAYRTDVAVSASTAQGGAGSANGDVNVDLKGGRFRVCVTNAGTPTTDLARIMVALYLSKV